VLTITTFSILINTAAATATSPKYMINFSGIGYKNYIFATSFGLTILAVAGIPPLAGFFSKLFILISTIGANYYFTTMIVIIFSSISCYYYIRLVKILFFVKGQKNNL
jgi:NADH-quinone oxidoreductase subunit N